MAGRARATVAGGTGAASTGWTVPAVALGTVIVLDVLRVWLPSVIFVYGRAGSTPATTMGAFALAWFLAGLLVAAVTGRLGPWRVVAGSAVVLAVCRLVLQGGPGGSLQLYASSIGVLAGIVWFAALAGSDVPRRHLATGFVVGLAGDLTLRTTLWTVELTWVHGIGAALAAVVLVGAFAAALLPAVRAGLRDVAGTARAAAWPWLIVGPVLLLFGVLSGVPSRALIATGWPVWFVGALLVAAHTLAVALTLHADRLSPWALAVEAAVLTIVGTVLALPADAPTALLGQVLLASGIAAAVGSVSTVPGAASPTRRAVATAGGMLLFFVLAFLYYAAYDLNLGIPNRALLVVGAVVVAALSLAGAARRRREEGTTGTSAFAAIAAATAGAMLLAAVGAGLSTRTAEPAAGDGLPVRIMTYNIHMGFDTAGRFDTDALAAVVRATGAEVVVLNEVDRGWFLNGGHDTVALMASALDLPYVWTPAADEVWGNAILSRYPLSDVRSTFLPQEGVPMRRSALGAVVELGGGDRLAVVGTHLHHIDVDGPVRLPQARAVAELAAVYLDRGLPTAVLGDLNAEPGTPELEPFLELGLEDAVTPLGDVQTFPSWGPVEHIDHILVSSDLTADELEVPRSEASDHLGVAVTVSRNG